MNLMASADRAEDRHLFSAQDDTLDPKYEDKF
jgi:hypothetical protein